MLCKKRQIIDFIHSAPVLYWTVNENQTQNKKDKMNTASVALFDIVFWNLNSSSWLEGLKKTTPTMKNMCWFVPN